MFKRTIAILCCTAALCLPGTAGAQTSISTATASQQLAAIYQAYDSMRNISFDVRIAMDTDTLNGQSMHSERSGNFTVTGKKYHYSMGGNEVVQNDSFLVSMYKAGRTMILDRARPIGINSILQSGGGSLDSILSAYAGAYNMFLDDTESGTKLLVLHAKGLQMPNWDIAVEYDPRRYYLISTKYIFYAPVREEKDSAVNGQSAGNAPRRHVLTTYYENYHFNAADFKTIFSESKFVRFDGRRYWPADAYRNYQFFDMISR